MQTPYQALDLAQGNIKAADATGTTLALISTDPKIQVFNISVAKTVTLPTTGIKAGTRIVIQNVGTALLTVQTSNATAISTVQGTTFTGTALVDTPTTSAHWLVSNPGQVIVGTTTSGNNVYATSGAAANIVLPVGLWLVKSKVHAAQTGASGTSASVLFSEISATSGASVGVDNESFSFSVMAAGAWTTSGARFVGATKILNVLATTTYFLNMNNSTLSGASGFTTVTSGPETFFSAVRLN